MIAYTLQKILKYVIMYIHSLSFTDKFFYPNVLSVNYFFALSCIWHSSRAGPCGPRTGQELPLREE